MSNILSDIHRQEIATTIIDQLDIRAYVDVGCYEGASIGWWNREDLQIYGCDINYKSLQCCTTAFPEAQLYHGDSRVWLRSVYGIPRPIVFYLDTDWVPDLAKYEEIDVILDRFPGSVIIANAVNEMGHPLYKTADRPWDVGEVFERYGLLCNQFIKPTYKYPILEQGYVVMNFNMKKIEFDRANFYDLLEDK